MGLGAVAGHLVVLIAVASAGTVLVGTLSGAYTETLDARAESIHRLSRASNERITLASSGYATLADSTYANFTNDGSREIDIDDVTLLVAGVVTSHGDAAVFQVLEDPTSNIWMPGETLEVRIDGQGDTDVSVVGPHGTAAHRRA